MPPLSLQIERAFTGPAWHGAALGELLSDITAREAATRPAPAVHTIAELAGHIGVWADAVRRRLAGEQASPTDEENFAPLDTSTEERWRAAVTELGARHAALARVVATLDDARLATTAPGQQVTLAETLHGVVEHDAYHGGQIAVVRALVRAERN